MLVKEALKYGKISNGNTKMPGTTYSIDAFACITGSKLAKVVGSVCNKCYAIRIQKIRPSVDKGYKLNLSKWLSSDPIEWIKAMVFLILRMNKGVPYHRWFDSGDLQSLKMLESICEVAKATPKVKHWLPTREVGIVSNYYKKHNAPFPSNLVVRVSSPMIDGPPLQGGYNNTSTVHTKGKQHTGHACPASHQGNQCLDCRACWNINVKNVSYPKH